MKFITLTNSGYLNYTRNLIESLRRIDITCAPEGEKYEPLKVYCIGQDCYDNLDYQNKELLNGGSGVADCPEDFQQFREGEWNKVVIQKLNVIHKELMNGNDVLFTDGDIVWLNNRFQNDISNRLDDNDILFQNDKQDDEDNSELCSGIMYVKNNERTRDLFDISKVDPNNFKCDQIFFNDNKHKFKYDKMPLKKYPNGRYFYTKQPTDPYCIHFNYVVGHAKEHFMKQYNHWYL